MKYLKNLIGIATVILLALAIINFHKTEKLSFVRSKIGILREFIKGKVEFFKQDVSFSFNPQRKRPLSFINRESELIHLAKDVFGQFTPPQWEKFWNLIYDPIEEKQGSSKVKRYRTQEEIQAYLRYNYSNPFSYFKKEHWNYFWSIVFKEKI
ncbi:MAG: hypothetical protein ABIE75_04975 [Candidatus Omnitrophota bacterium]